MGSCEILIGVICGFDEAFVSQVYEWSKAFKSDGRECLTDVARVSSSSSWVFFVEEFSAGMFLFLSKFGHSGKIVN